MCSLFRSRQDATRANCTRDLSTASPHRGGTSTQEGHTLKGVEGVKSLKGGDFDNFAGFFSRRYRENDYLLGRLHALDRLMDMVCDAAGAGVQYDGIDVLGLKRRA